MRSWYQNCKNPTEEKLKFFVSELNRGHVRNERPKITVGKIKIWWKNERQREKRLKQKQVAEKSANAHTHPISPHKSPSASCSRNGLNTYNITEIGNEENRVITQTIIQSQTETDSDIDIMDHSPPMRYHESDRSRIIVESNAGVTLNNINRRDDESGGIYDRERFTAPTGPYEYRYVL